MIEVKYASAGDISFWLSLDEHISKKELCSKINREECYILKLNSKNIGIMRYNFFWDNIPFLNMIFISSEFQNKGYGKFAVDFWESEMKKLDFQLVMTSSQSDETAQFFYRKIGYSDAGYLLLDTQVPELFFMKKLNT